MTKFDNKIVSTMLLDVMPYTNEKKNCDPQTVFDSDLQFQELFTHCIKCYSLLVSFASEVIKFVIH